jgi:hypothetical protein
MAEQIAHDVVKEAQLTGGTASVGDSETTIKNLAGAGENQALPASINIPTPTEAYTIQDATTEERKDGTDGETTIPLVVEEGVDAPLPVPSEGADNLVVATDMSGGSDTDTGRVEGSETVKDWPGHARSNSIKKPTTFKSVSVTKSFLAKSASGSPSVKGTAESRGSPSLPVDARNALLKGAGSSPAGLSGQSQLIARPRLVAKSGSSGLTPRSSLKPSSGNGGPDASKVWNKNRRMFRVCAIWR